MKSSKGREKRLKTEELRHEEPTEVDSPSLLLCTGRIGIDTSTLVQVQVIVLQPVAGKNADRNMSNEKQRGCCSVPSALRP